MAIVQFEKNWNDSTGEKLIVNYDNTSWDQDISFSSSPNLTPKIRSLELQFISESQEVIKTVTVSQGVGPPIGEMIINETQLVYITV